MNICISGALGHIGSRLIRMLSIPGLKRVYLVDNMLTQRYGSLFDLPGDIDFVFKEIDVLSDEMASIVEQCNILVHLAAVTDAERSFERVEEVEEVNKRGIEYVADLCAKLDCSLLFPSSTSVYGSQSEFVDEDCPEEDLRPQSPYADSKIYGEKVLKKLGENGGLRFVCFRLGTIFGFSFGMRFHTAVNKFIWQAATDQCITVWRTALHQKRPYCGLNDCCRAINFFVGNDLFDNTVYNIVTANFTVNNIISIIRKYIPDVNVTLVDSPIMNQLSYEVSNKKSLDVGVSYKDEIEASIVEVLCRLKNVNSDVGKKDIVAFRKS